MLALSILAGLTTTISAVAIPQTVSLEPTTGGTEPLYPNSIDVKYFQGTPIIDPELCGTEVSSGIMTQEHCNTICTYGISVAQLPKNNCVFTLFRGNAFCLSNTVEKISYPVPAGNGTVCITTGVEDGCIHQFASGTWSCG